MRTHKISIIFFLGFLKNIENVTGFEGKNQEDRHKKEFYKTFQQGENLQQFLRVDSRLFYCPLYCFEDIFPCRKRMNAAL